MVKARLIVIAISIMLLSILGKTQNVNLDSVGFYAFNGSSAVATFGNYMYTCNGKVIKINDPGNLSEAGSFSVSSLIVEIEVIDNHLYIGTGMVNMFHIVNVATPTVPYSMGSLSFSSSYGGIFGIAVKDDVAFLAAGGGGFYTVDISDKSNPYILDSIVFSGQARDVEIKDCYAYVSAFDGLHVIDVHNADSIFEINSFGSGYNSVDLYGDTIYLSVQTGGIHMIDISDPYQLAIAAGNSVSEETNRIKYHCGSIYVATDPGNLYVYKENGGNLSLYAYFDGHAGQAFDVEIAMDSLVILPCLVDGVYILDHDSMINCAQYPVYHDTCNIEFASGIRESNFYDNINVDMTRDNIIIKVEDVSNKNISAFLYDNQAKSCLFERGSGQELTLNKSTLKNGIYYLKVCSDQSIYTNKLIIIK